MFERRSQITLSAVTLLATSPALAVTNPFTESFDTDAANWGTNVASTPATHVATGGAIDNGGYISTVFDFSGTSAGQTPVLFRGQDELGSSGGAFEGNYIADGVTEYSMYVRHNAPTPLTFFTRFASAVNFPGGTAIEFVPVLPNQWTEIVFAIDPSNPEFVSFSGTSFGAVFSSIGHVQPGIEVPAALGGANTQITFDLDEVTIVPEPATLGLAALGGLAMLTRRRAASAG
ncbi:MAG: PEP-CTERM sorting domain-containing protein [Planctomycetota bacterium]